MKTELQIKDTTADIKWLCPIKGDPYPQGDKVICLSKYGVVTASKFIAGFHIGYIPLPKMDSRIRELLEL